MRGLDGSAAAGVPRIPAQLPDAECRPRQGQNHKGPKYGRLPFVEGFGPQVDDPPPVGDAEPSLEAVAKGPPAAECGEKSLPRRAQRPGRQQKGPQRDRRRQDRRQKNHQQGVPLGPPMHSILEPRRHIPLDRLLPALLAQPPGRPAAEDAPDERARHNDPGAASMADEPEQQQVGRSRNGERNDGRIDERNDEYARRAQVHQPVKRRVPFTNRGAALPSQTYPESHLNLEVHFRAAGAREQFPIRLSGPWPLPRLFYPSTTCLTRPNGLLTAVLKPSLSGISGGISLRA